MRLKRRPTSQPKKMARGVAINTQSRKPSMPVKPQYTTKNTAICAAMAPMTIPKLRPMPASTGISRESTVKPLRPMRVNSSADTKVSGLLEA